MDRTERTFYRASMTTEQQSGKTRIGIDFGTTNSVVVVRSPDGTTRTARFPLPDGGDADTCRTLLALWQDEENSRLTLHKAIGAGAVEAWLEDPSETRLIMSMKSWLAQASFRETQIFGKRVTLETLIATFLRELMAQGQLKPEDCAVTVGRPVRFVGENADDDLGEQRLRAALTEAGFTQIAIMPEPEAAGWRFARRLTQPATVLVGDFGGGTSDFSVMRFDPTGTRSATALGYAGVGLAGDQFDFRITDHVIAPWLGKNTTFSIMGGEPLPVPVEWYAAFARWHRLSLMRSPKILNEIAEVARTCSEPALLTHLTELLKNQHGQALYNAVSAAKRALSSAERTTLRYTQPGLKIETEITRADFNRWIAPDIARLAEGIDLAVTRAGLAPDQIDRVFLTGGTSFVPAVRALFTDRFGADKVELGGEFVSVAEGLALGDAISAPPSSLP